jgi:protein arginine kinase
MAKAQPQAETWKRLVLRSLPPPAWLSPDAPYSDIVLSSRCRLMRNLRGFRFPHHAPLAELERVCELIVSSGRDGFEVHKRLTTPERDYLLGCRLLSPEFPYQQPFRALLLDRSHTTSIMVNEEDHLRLQALTAGWSVDAARRTAERALSDLRGLEYAQDEAHGFLAASPFNAGDGRRLSAMLHLIGLASRKRLPALLKALTARGLAVRGLFGESSRAVGAFVQISSTERGQNAFMGACEYLIREERDARGIVPREEIAERTRAAIDFALPARTLGLADALRVVAWIRWAACAGLPGYVSPRVVDAWLTRIEVRALDDEQHAGRARAEFVRMQIEESLSID